MPREMKLKPKIRVVGAVQVAGRAGGLSQHVVEVLARGPAEVIPLHRKEKAL